MTEVFKSYHKRCGSFDFPSRVGDQVHFYPTKWYTAFSVTSGVHAVVESRAWSVSAGNKSIKDAFLLISHGILSAQYSLLDVDPARRGGFVGRPVALYTSPAKYVNRGKIVDLTFDLGQPAQEFDLVLPAGAYSQGHIEFCPSEDYRYEWRYEDLERTGVYAYHLWRHRLVDGQIVLAGRISSALFRSPVDGSLLWTLELDTDRVRPEIAFLSAFMVKSLRPIPLFSRNVPAPPRMAVNICFEDEGVVLQRESKYPDDWEAEAGIETKVRVQVIRVYNPEYLAALRTPQEVLSFLEVESAATARNVRDRYGTALGW